MGRPLLLLVLLAGCASAPPPPALAGAPPADARPRAAGGGPGTSNDVPHSAAADAGARAPTPGPAVAPDAGPGVLPSDASAARSPAPVRPDDAPPPPARPGAPDDAPPPPGALVTPRGPDFRNGEPVVPVRLMEGQARITFVPRGRMRVRFGGETGKVLEAPAGTRWTVRVTDARPAEVTARVQLAELRFADREGLAAELALWRGRGLAVRVHTLGAVFGIAGKVLDNRRALVVVDEPLPPADAARRQAALLREYGVRTTLLEEVRTRASGILEVSDADGSVVGLAQDALDAETLDGAGFEVARVEYGVGYDFHGFEDRTFRGALRVTVDRTGALAAVNLVPLEQLLMGLVPAEIFARAPAEALKAQAVAARGEVLAKVGTKHLGDPYLLCSEQHCAVYKGRGGEAASTNAAVEATRGLALFDAGGRLVDTVYSAVCGGHTEHNDVVWGGPPDPSLRGRPDLLAPATVSPGQLDAWLSPATAATLPAACRRSSFAQPSKFRWQRRFTAAQLDALTASLGVGPVRALAVTERGVSGRARLLTVAGERGATQVRGELNIRRLFGMLNSAMFTVAPERDAAGRITAWVFQGGGWGHGVGMCQTGAIGRAEAGHSYRDILRHYFNGAEVAPLY